MVDTIKDRLARGELTMIAGVGRVMHHNVIQMIGMGGGFHGLWFDHEHVGFSIESLEVAAIAAKSVGLDCFVRVAPTDYALVTRCLEAGGSGVMAAQIHSAEDAEQFVRWAKFYPRGRRGLNTGGVDAKFGRISPADFVVEANERTWIAIQIETEQAVEECDAIAAIDGVDALFVGPSDLSQSLGVVGDFFHEKCIDAIDRVAAACGSRGKHWGAVCVSPDHARMLIEKGCRLISPTSDSKIVNAGVESVKGTYAELFAGV